MGLPATDAVAAVSLYALATGVLLGDPQRRDGTKGPFATATLRLNGDEPEVVSIIGFGAASERLLELAKGDALSISGRARLTSWTGRDGIERRGLSVIAEQVAVAKPRTRSPTRTRRRAGTIRRPYPTPRSTHDSAPLPDDRVDDLYVLHDDTA
jgi:single-stranded DNA-binding protein